MRDMKVLLVAAAVTALATACAHGAHARTTSAPCTAAQLSGSFSVLKGSAGAGNIVYRLRLTNKSASSCTVTGLPKATLLTKSRKAQPTHVVAAYPNLMTAVLVTLAHGKSAYADARFSPDVPGVGEGKAGVACEPTSYWLRVAAPGGGSRTVAIRPPTPVCEHGRLQFSGYGSVPKKY